MERNEFFQKFITLGWTQEDANDFWEMYIEVGPDNLDLNKLLQPPPDEQPFPKVFVEYTEEDWGKRDLT